MTTDKGEWLIQEKTIRSDKRGTSRVVIKTSVKYNCCPGEGGVGREAKFIKKPAVSNNSMCLIQPITLISYEKTLPLTPV